MDKLSISNEMAQLDLKQYEFFDQLTDEERKKFSTFIIMKYGASVEGSKELQEWYLRATNEQVNVNFFDLGKHVKLQWLMCATVSPGLGKQRHYWSAPSKKTGGRSKKIKFLSQLYPNARKDEIELLAKINTDADLEELAKSMGLSDTEVKKVIKD
jgi:hypothetical protein